MSQKNETAVLALSLVLTVGLIGAGAWWFTRQFLDGQNPLTVQTPGASSQTSSSSRQSLQDRLSVGERSLVPGYTSTARQAGINAFAAGQYEEAVQQLETALRESRNDPEALIYLNNARIGDQQAYTLAIAAPIGASPNVALELLRGVAQAQDDVNQAGGIEGVPLRILIADDGNDPESAQQIAQALVKDADVLGVIGHYSSGISLAVAPIYDQGELVMISPTSTSVELSGVSPYVFRTVPSDRFAATALARYMLQNLQQQSVAVFFDSESNYSQSIKSEFTTAVFSDGGQIVTEFDMAASTFNPAQAVQQALDLNAEVLMFAATNPDTLNPSLQVIAVNRQRLGLLGGDELYHPDLLQIAGENAVGMAVAVPWHVLSHLQSPFVQDSRRLWGGDVSWRTATTYDAARALIEGLAQNSSRGGLQQALRTTGFAAEGATSTVQFLPSGDRNQAAQIMIVQPGNRSGYGYDFVPARSDSAGN